METWNTFSLFVCLIPYFMCLRLQQQSYYVGCYGIASFGNNTIMSRTRLNNGTFCIHFCKNSGYRYAGTQVQNCKCGNRLLTDSKQSKCKYKCPGQRRELCGGEESMSVYEIYSIHKTEVTSIASTTEENSMSKEKFDQNKGGTRNGPVSIYISVPVLIIVVVAVTVVVMFFLRRIRRRNGDKYACFRRKKVENYRRPFQAATNKTYNVNSLNEYDGCIRYSPENLGDSVTNIYAEIAFGSTQSIETSENAENGHSTFSVDVPSGRYEAGAPEIIGTYDTIQTSSKTNTIKTKDVFNVYDHVTVGNHNNQATGTDEYSHYSHLDAVQKNNVQQTYFRIIDSRTQTVNRSDRSSTDCGDRDRSDRSSADCGDQDDRSHHEYVILEPDGHSVVQE